MTESSQPTTITFHVCDVEVADRLLKQLPTRFLMEEVTDGPIEAFAWRLPSLVDTLGQYEYFLSEDDVAEMSERYPYEKDADSYRLMRDFQKSRYRLHPMIGTVHQAFALHYPLTLSPDHIWLLLCQGFANHVNTHAEKLRSKFVQHQGKITLEVRRDAFIKDSPDNDWENVFAEFIEQIGQHIGSTAALMTGGFSTTGPIEQAAFNVTLLDATQQYFDYMVSTFCGIPDITLEGTPADWQAVLDRFKKFTRFDLRWWVEAASPILQEFVNAANGNVNTGFWNSIYKIDNESGGPYINGWIVKLFPYLQTVTITSETTLTRNPYVSANSAEQGFIDRITADKFPSGLSQVPFKWQYHDTVYDMNFIAGFVGASQDKATRALRPEIGWGVGEQATSLESDQLIDENLAAWYRAQQTKYQAYSRQVEEHIQHLN